MGPSERVPGALSLDLSFLGWSEGACFVIFSKAALPFLSWVLPTFIQRYIETLSLREAPSLCLLIIKVNLLLPSLGLLASLSPPSRPIGTNGSPDLCHRLSSRQPRS